MALPERVIAGKDSAGAADFETVEDARLYCDPPTLDHYKCLNCGTRREVDTGKSYEQQADCQTPRCTGQMMGHGWGGWFNRWRDLAVELLEARNESRHALERARADKEYQAAQVKRIAALLETDAETRAALIDAYTTDWNHRRAALAAARSEAGELRAERDRLREACKKALTCASLNSDVAALIRAVLRGES